MVSNFIGFIGVYIVLNPDFNDFDFMKFAPVDFKMNRSFLNLKKSLSKSQIY